MAIEVAASVQLGLVTWKVSMEEVLDTIFSLDASKALGSHGFTMVFYHKCQGIIKDDLIVLKEFYENSSVGKESNSNFIVLISKVTGSETLKEYRPISSISRRFVIFSLQF